VAAIKFRVAKVLRKLGLYPRSEVEALREQSKRDHAWLKKRNEQLQRRVEQLDRTRSQLKERIAQLEERN
jgi:DNA repair exonuclease SbcCD ATPase subunit